MAERAEGARWNTLDLVTALWVAWALAGLFWTPHDPNAQTALDRLREGPSWAHPLGVDALGRDLASRVWRGSGNTVWFGAAAAAGTLVLASALLVMEQRGPRFARGFVSPIVSAGLAMPVLFVGLLLLVFLRPAPWTLVVACALGGVPFGFRQLRVVWLEQAGALYATASRALGAGPWHVVCFTIWPNARGQVVSVAKLLFAVSVLELSGLTFLGLAGDPDFPELGAILRQNQSELFREPMLVLWPGVFLSGLLLLVHLSNVRSR